jgi:hypothetical protein
VGKGILALIQRIKTPVRMMQRMLISVRVRLYYNKAPFVFIQNNFLLLALLGSGSGPLRFETGIG